MEFPVPAYTSFTIPTGATTGARITFNEFGDGLIRVYNSLGRLVDTVGGDKGDIISFGLFGPDIAMEAGVLLFGSAAAGFSPAANIKSPSTNLGILELSSGASLAGVGNLDPAVIDIQAGVDNLATGNANSPRLIVRDGHADSACDIHVSGSIVKSDLTINGVPLTWQNPAYAANWSAGASASGLGGDGLQFHLMPDDTLWLFGLATAAAGAGTTVFTLPAGSRPVSGTPHGQCLLDRGGVLSIQEMAITGAGTVFIGFTPNAGDTISVNFNIPLKNVP